MNKYKADTEFEKEALEKLKQLMRQPAYWRDRDPKIVKQVTKGFELLYDEPSNDKDLPEARLGQAANLLGLNGNKNKKDTKIAHLTPGEIIIPQNYQTPQLMRYLESVMGQELKTYTIGSGQERVNPKSGLPAFYEDDHDDVDAQNWNDPSVTDDADPASQSAEIDTPPPPLLHRHRISPRRKIFV